MKESEGKILYLKEICFIQIILRRIYRLRREQYVEAMIESCAFIPRKITRNCLVQLYLYTERKKDFKSLRFDAWIVLNIYAH